MDPRKQAIDAALKQNWAHAIELNLNILEQKADDTEALNRLGFAYFQKGNIKKALSAYTKALKFDPYNPIAQKSLDKLKLLSDYDSNPCNQDPLPLATSFIEEPGKTKTVTLVRLAGTKFIASLIIGTQIILIPKKFRISVETQNHQYVGCLPDDLAFKLNPLIKLGYTYECFVKANSSNSLSVFIREICRSKKANFLPSFPYNNNSINILPDDTPIFHSPIDTNPTGEDYD